MKSRKIITSIICILLSFIAFESMALVDPNGYKEVKFQVCKDPQGNIIGFGSWCTIGSQQCIDNSCN